MQKVNPGAESGYGLPIWNVDIVFGPPKPDTGCQCALMTQNPGTKVECVICTCNLDTTSVRGIQAQHVDAGCGHQSRMRNRHADVEYRFGARNTNVVCGRVFRRRTRDMELRREIWKQNPGTQSGCGI